MSIAKLQGTMQVSGNPSRQYAEGRRCETCNTKLSRYNSEMRCSIHARDDLPVTRPKAPNAQLGGRVPVAPIREALQAIQHPNALIVRYRLRFGGTEPTIRQKVWRLTHGTNEWCYRETYDQWAELLGVEE